MNPKVTHLSIKSTPSPKPHRAAPTVTVSPKQMKQGNIQPLDFDSNAMFLDRATGQHNVMYGTATSNASRCRRLVVEALEKVGTPAHQAWALHEVLSKNPNFIPVGMALGVAEKPGRSNRAKEQVIKSIQEFLHSQHVFGKSTNESIGAQLNTFLICGPTAPSPSLQGDDLVKATKQYQQELRNFNHLFKVPKTSRRRIKEVAQYRGDILENAFQKPELVLTHRRESTSIVNEESKAIVKDYLLHHCTLVHASPNQRDSVKVKDELDVVTEERRYFYEGSQQALFEEFLKPVSEGGCAFAYDEDTGKRRFGLSTFQKLLPVCVVPMNNNHKVQMSCQTCQNADYAIDGRTRFWAKRVQHFQKLIHYFQ